MKTTTVVIGLALLLAGVAGTGVAELLLYLPFEEGTGNSTEDESGNGYVGAVNEGATWVEGQFGYAIDFDGETGMIAFGDHPDLRLPKHITLEAWVTVRDPSPIQFAAGVPYRDTKVWDNPWVGHQIGIEKKQFLSWLSIEGTNRQYSARNELKAETEIQPDTWYHIAMTFDGTTRRSYLNGELTYDDSSISGNTTFEGSPHFVVGSHSVHAPGEFFGGTVDEVALYNHVLTEDEIRSDMDGRLFVAVAPSGRLATTWASLKGKW